MSVSSTLGSILVGALPGESTKVADYLLDQVGKPKVRQQPAQAPDPKHRVKQAMSVPSVSGANSAAKTLAKSQKIGVPKMEVEKVKPISIKFAMAVSQYSGTLGPGKFDNYASYVPPFRKPQLKMAGPDMEELARVQNEQNKKSGFSPVSKLGSMTDELSKLNSIQSPASQMAKSQRVGTPKASPPKGPSIAQVSKPVGFGKPLAGATKTGSLDKEALIERLVRLAATPIKGTPKAVMKVRSPKELGALQKAVGEGYDKRVTEPLMGLAERGLKKLPAGKVQDVARKGAKILAQDPAGALLSNMVPMPGASPAYLAGKKGLERVIDRVVPVPA